MNFLTKIIFRRRQAYRAVFGQGGDLGKSTQIVLADLHAFCRAGQSTAVHSHIAGKIDPLATMIAEGRREVWLRIIQHLNVSDADLHRIVHQEDDYRREESGTD
jgi:hypothetical protein